MKHLQRFYCDEKVILDPNRLNLDRNESTSDEINAIVNSIYSQIDYTSCSYYGYNSYNCYHKLADYHNISHRDILLTNGCDGAIRTYFEHNRGSKCLITRPSFAMIEVYAHYYCEDIVYVDYDNVDRDINDISPILKGIEQLMYGDIVVLATPESPTGKQYNKDQLLHIIDVCKWQGVKLLLDETYILYGNTPTMMPFIDDTLSICRSFSKSYGVAGVRLGYLVCKDHTIHDSKPMLEIGNFQAQMMEGIIDNMSRFLIAIEGRIKLRNELSSYKGIINTYGNFIHIDKNIINIDKLHKIAYSRQIDHPSMMGVVRLTLPNKLSCIQSILN